VKPAYINLLDLFLSWISATTALELPVKDAPLISFERKGPLKLWAPASFKHLPSGYQLLQLSVSCLPPSSVLKLGFANSRLGLVRR
jgi:hypothetical protein